MKKLIPLLLSVLTLNAAETTITALPAISTVTSSTVLPVVDVSGTPTTKKATASQLLGGLPDATGSNRGVMTATQAAQLAGATNTNTASTLVQRDASGNFAAGTITAGTVTGLSSPVNATDAANKGYVDAASAGLVIKTPAVAGTVGSNITLSGGAPNTLDGVTLVANNRILVKDQTDNKENGIYYVATLGSGSNGTWARTTDADTGAELVTGSYVFISGGTVNANAAYTMTTTGTITIGTSPIVWNLFSQVTQIQASNILGQIVAAQIQDAAVNTAKFASGIQPVSIVSSLPSPSGYTGPSTLFNTSDSKLYRYTGSAFVATVQTVDLTGTITTTQIADNSISTPKLQALSVAAGNIASNAITAGKIAANAVTAGTIAAGAVSTTELAANAVTTAKLYAGAVDTNALAANAVTAAKIQAGTITADKMNVANLAAISANIGTITSGSLTSSASVTVGSGYSAVSITSAGLSVASGVIDLKGDGGNPWIRLNGSGSYAGQNITLNGNVAANLPPFLQFFDGSIAAVNINPSGGVTMGDNKPIKMGAGTSYFQKLSSDGWTPPLYDGDNTIEFQWNLGLKVRIDGSTVLNITTTP